MQTAVHCIQHVNSYSDSHLNCFTIEAMIHSRFWKEFDGISEVQLSIELEAIIQKYPTQFGGSHTDTYCSLKYIETKRTISAG